MQDQEYKGLFRGGKLKAIGQIAEAAAYNFLETRPLVSSIEDVREKREWQAQEVDFRVRIGNGRVVNVEVKSDEHIARTGNFLFELCRVRHEGSADGWLRPGWSVFSAAHRFMIYCPPSALLYVIDSNDFRQAVQLYMRKEKPRIDSVWSSQRCVTVNVLIPAGRVPHTKYIYSGGDWLAVN